jgi:hypothetical protein
MTSNVDLIISINGTKETAKLICDDKAVSITFVMEKVSQKTYSDTDFYRCFGQIRKDSPHIQFLCKGSKINVHPSSMSSQMSLGLKAYELTLGKKASMEDIIYIFDYDETNLTNDPDEQRDFFRKWIESEKK